MPIKHTSAAYYSDKFYGVEWDESTDTYVRTGLLAGVAVGSSPGDPALPVHARMRGCLFSDAGVVQYYLSSSDRTKKADGSASVLTGADGQVVVRVPAFWERYSYTSPKHRWDISLFPIAGFTIHPAFIKNGVEVSARYIGAYEGVLYDDSQSVYTSDYNPVASHNATFDVDDGTGKGTITAAAGTPYSLLQAGDVIVVTGTADNNGTYIIDSVAGGNVITCTGVIAGGDGAEATTVISAPAVDTANDVLSSVSGKKAVSGITRANFRSIAANRGTGWRQLDFYLASAIQLLYLIEYADFYSQSMIGAGLTDWAGGTWNAYNAYHPINNSGLSNGDGDGVNSVSNGDGNLGSYMTYRGIENWYGHLWKFVDGLNVHNYDDDAGTAYSRAWASNIDTDFADDVSAGYSQIGDICESDGWQNTLLQAMSVFLPLTVGAGGTTKVTDYYYTYFDNLVASFDDWRVALLGGRAFHGADAGGFYWHLYSGSGCVSATFTGRVTY